MEPELEHAYLATNGISLHVVRAGPEDGPLVILLHGFPELWCAWSRYVPFFAARGFRVLAPDQRGYNLSDKPLQVAGYRLDVLAEDVLGLIEGEGEKKRPVYLVGHDFGAAVAWWLAIRHPDRLSKLVVLNVPHPLVMRAHLLTDPSQIRRSWYMFFFQLPFLPERAIRAEGGRRFLRALKRTARPGIFDGMEDAYLEAWSQPGAARSMIHWYRAALRSVRDAPPEDPRVKAPALILWGKRDHVLRSEMAEESLAYCDAGELVWLEDASHWVAHEEFDAVSTRIADFLA